VEWHAIAVTERLLLGEREINERQPVPRLSALPLASTKAHVGRQLLREVLAGPLRLARRAARIGLTGKPRSAGCSPALLQLRWYRYGDSNPGPVAENHVS
jgi:hypothetical protein